MEDRAGAQAEEDRDQPAEELCTGGCGGGGGCVDGGWKRAGEEKMFQTVDANWWVFYYLGDTLTAK